MLLKQVQSDIDVVTKKTQQPGTGTAFFQMIFFFFFKRWKDTTKALTYTTTSSDSGVQVIDETLKHMMKSIH